MNSQRRCTVNSAFLANMLNNNFNPLFKYFFQFLNILNTYGCCRLNELSNYIASIIYQYHIFILCKIDYFLKSIKIFGEMTFCL